MVENKLYKVEDLVMESLQQYPETRTDDFLLILRVYALSNKAVKHSCYNETFAAVLLNHKELNLISFESITRCRRKLQVMYPELQAPKEIQIFRTNETATYIEYALDI